MTKKDALAVPERQPPTAFRCQQQNADGYLGGVPGGRAMWQQVKAGQINANSFGLDSILNLIFSISPTWPRRWPTWAPRSPPACTRPNSCS